MYYNEHTLTYITSSDVQRMGISSGNTAALKALGLVPIQERIPTDIDLILYTVVPTPLRRDEDHYVLQYKAVPLPLPIARASLKNRIAARRYEAEMGGTALPDGARLATGVESRTRLQTALDAVQDVETVSYKLGGEFKALTRADLLAIRNAVSAHVQACFDKERTLHEAIDAAETVAALEGIEWKDGWPGQSRPEAAQTVEAVRAVSVWWPGETGEVGEVAQDVVVAG